MAWRSAISKNLQELRWAVRPLSRPSSSYPLNVSFLGMPPQTSWLNGCRVHLCQKGDASKGAREFVLSQYQHLKKANPKFPILIRECSGAEARLIARYDFGVEHTVPIDGLDSSAIASKLEDLVKKGDSMPRSSESEGKLEA